jgi:hypothetical protein
VVDAAFALPLVYHFALILGGLRNRDAFFHPAVELDNSS